MAELTDLEQLLYHLDKASDIAFRLRNSDEFGINMVRLSNYLINTTDDLLEHNDEAHIPTDEY
jgi:hypothetical protein